MSRKQLQTAVRSGLRYISSCLNSRQFAMLGTGVLAGFYFFVFFTQFIITFGMSLPAVSGVAVVIALATSATLLTGRRTLRVQATTNLGSTRGDVLTHFALAVWVVAFSWLLQFTASVIGRIPAELLANHRALQTAVFFAAAFVLLFPTVAWISSLPIARICRWQRRDQVESPTIRISDVIASFLLGIAIGLVLAVQVVGPQLGVQFTGFVAAVVGICAAFLILLRTTIECGHNNRHVAVSRNEPSDGEFPMTDSRQSNFSQATTITAVACLGLLFAALERFGQQLMPSSGWMIGIKCGTLLAGVALGLLYRSRQQLKSPTNAGRHGSLLNQPGLFVAVYYVLLIAAFPLMVHCELIIKSYISELWLLAAAQTAMSAAIWLPLGFIAGHLAWISNASAGSEEVNHTVVKQSARAGVVLGPIAAVLGYLAARWFVLPTYGVSVSVVATAWAIAAIALLTCVRTQSFCWSRKRWATVAVSVGILAVAPVSSRRYDPGLSAKLLFDTNAFLAHRSGTDFDLIPHIDEGRCVAFHETDRGTATFFHYRGSQIQIRESGTPKGILSSNPRICPEYAAEVVHAVLPMTLVQSPRRVLVLGFGSGTPLATCLAFPVREVTCIEPDARFLDAARQAIATRNRPDVFADQRVTFLKTDASLTLRTQSAQYDVILENSGSPSLAHSAWSMTQDYYRQVAGRLADNGLFCQRFDFVDYGPDAIKCVFRTLQSVFPQVIAVESAPGSLVLLASFSEQSPINDTLVARLQIPHVRHALSQVGWDWAVVLKLSVWPNAALAEMAKSDHNEINTASNGLLAMRLPLDMMRWGPKYRDARELLDPLSHHVVQLLGDAATEREVKRRIKELSLQRELMARHPDQYWAYRKKAKHQVSKNPRSQIIHVSGKMPRRGFHPEDKRRMAYFKALGAANDEQHPSRDSLDELASFEFPYDPMISFFLHGEFAELSKRAEDRDVRTELIHRLHAIHFSSVTDRSIRNVIDALELLNQHPEAATDAAKRWDHINALLQTMKVRWHRRMNAHQESSRIVMNDLEKSLSVADRSIELLGQLAEQAGIGTDAAKLRQQVLERELLRPLRTFRGKVLPKYQKAEERRRELADETRAVQPISN